MFAVSGIGGQQALDGQRTVKLSSLNSSDEDPATNADWSYPVTQTLLFIVPKYCVDANAANIGSKEPVSSVYPISDNSHERTRHSEY